MKSIYPYYAVQQVQDTTIFSFNLASKKNIIPRKDTSKYEWGDVTFIPQDCYCS